MISYFNSILFFILCLGTLFLNMDAFTDTQILPKWLFGLLLMPIIGIILCLQFFFLYKVDKFNINHVFIVISCLCTLQAVYGILQLCDWVPSSTNLYPIVGSFDNPAGFVGCLCAGAPFSLYFFNTKSKYIRLSIYFMLAIIVFAVFASQSRAGIMSLVTIACVILVYKIKLTKVFRFFILGGITCLFLMTSYFFKKDSADGRLLIWQCSWEMIKKKPLFGHGAGAFEAHYMDYQAEYFRKNPNSRFEILADNVKHPFNEYLSIGIQYGVMGWVAIAAVGLFLLYCYQKSSSSASFICLLSLLSIAVFAFFSYPFAYPFIWIVAIIDIYLLIAGFCKDVRVSYSLQITMVTSVLLFCILVLPFICSRMKAEKEWRVISCLSFEKQRSEVMLRYKQLLPQLGKSPYFLYNYAVELYKDRQYLDCLEVANLCRNYYWADYDLDILRAEAYTNLEKNEEAKSCLQKAALMCPVRFTPLYKLYKIYGKEKNTIKADSLAYLIQCKPVKINSSRINYIKRKVGMDPTGILETKYK